MKRDIFIHRLALVETDAVGEGTRIWPYAHVMKGAIVGRNCNVGEHCFIESGATIGDGVTVKNGVAVWDGVTIEDDVFIGPYAVFTNVKNPRSAFKKSSAEFDKTLIKRGATIGANATVVCGVTVGEYAFIAAGSVVTKDIPAHRLAAGVPAKAKGWMCVCGLRLRAGGRCDCGRRYRVSPNRVQPLL